MWQQGAMADEGEAVYDSYDPIQADLQASYARKTQGLHEHPLMDNPPKLPPKDKTHKRKATQVVASPENTQNDTTADHGDDQHQHDGEGEMLESLTAKRQRTSDWPLRRQSLRHGSESGSPSRPSDESQDSAQVLSPRSSRFVEGSMNDRVSKRPPAEFIGNDESEEYHLNVKTQMQKAGLTHHPNQSISVSTTSTNMSKESGVSRLRKALSYTFNPFNWGSSAHLLPEPQLNPEDEKRNAMKERQAKATEAYAKLKKEGFKGTEHRHTGSQNRQDSVIPEAPKQPRARIQKPKAAEHSGKPATTETKEHNTRGRSRQKLDLLVPPPVLGKHHRSQSPLISDGSPPKAKHLQRSSLQNLKKVASHVQLRNQKKTVPPNPSTVTQESEAKNIVSTPSKKDQKKLQKLARKESNLEQELERIRREKLALQQDEPPPVPTIPAQLGGKRNFVPGALPSLPSERLLQRAGSLEPKHGSDHNDSDGDAHVARGHDPTSGISTSNMAPKVKQEPESRALFVHPDRRELIHGKIASSDMLDRLEASLEDNPPRTSFERGRKLSKKRKIEAPTTLQLPISKFNKQRGNPPSSPRRRSRSWSPSPESRHQTPVSPHIHVDKPDQAVSVSPGKQGNEQVPPVPSLPDHLRFSPVRVGSGNIGVGHFAPIKREQPEKGAVDDDYDWDDEIF